jgi:hypothetical protein
MPSTYIEKKLGAVPYASHAVKSNGKASGLTEKIYQGHDGAYWVQTIVNSSQVAVWVAVTSCDDKFRPNFGGGRGLRSESFEDLGGGEAHMAFESGADHALFEEWDNPSHASNFLRRIWSDTAICPATRDLAPDGLFIYYSDDPAAAAEATGGRLIVQQQAALARAYERKLIANTFGWSSVDPNSLDISIGVAPEDLP